MIELRRVPDNHTSMAMTGPIIASNTLELIGNTPLVLLKGPSEAADCEIWGKCEFANPGASVKDRAALWIVRDAEARGTLLPGGTIVEGTAGNTGIGLALVANALGYKTVIVIPETQSRDLRPEEFMQAALDTGLIRAIDEWVLRTACRHSQEWQQRGKIPEIGRAHV